MKLTNTHEFKLGDKVVPHSKSIGVPLSVCIDELKGQPLEVVSVSDDVILVQSGNRNYSFRPYDLEIVAPQPEIQSEITYKGILKAVQSECDWVSKTDNSDLNNALMGLLKAYDKYLDEVRKHLLTITVHEKTETHATTHS